LTHKKQKDYLRSFHILERLPMDPARMIPGIIGAAIGGLVGAILWAVVIFFAQKEIGIIAWGVGGLVGFGGLLLGARGTTMGVICGLVALLSICGGKLVGFQLVSLFPSETVELADEEEDDHELYEEFMEDARQFASVKGDDAIRAFMVKRDYTLQSSPSAISDEELYEFRADMEGDLLSWGESPPTYEEWYNEWYEIEPEYEGEGAAESETALGTIWNSFGLFDIIFFFLGVTTAFQMVASRPQEAL
jgi:hypothetical protein